MGEYDFILFEVNIMKHINRQLLLFIFTLIIATASTPVLAIACLGAGESLQQCAVKHARMHGWGEHWVIGSVYNLRYG